MECMRVKISVVVPTYDRPLLLKKCLEGLIKQNFPKEEFEVIIVTDGHDEVTCKMIDKVRCENDAKNIFCFSLPEKKGPAAARNKGWRASKGELILFTDDDCIPAEKWVSFFWKMYTQQQRKIAAFTGGIIVPHNGKRPTDHERNTIALEKADFVTANCAVTKEALEKVNGFDEAFKMAWREDSDLEFKLLNAGIVIPHVEEAAVFHPVRKTKWGVSLRDQKKSMFNALLYKKYPELYKKRINRRPVWLYYGIILLACISATAAFLKSFSIAVGALLGWILLVTYFTAKRLSGASLSLSHITEMIVTSMLIPFLSVYWTLYGSYKYKVLFL